MVSTTFQFNTFNFSKIYIYYYQILSGKSDNVWEPTINNTADRVVIFDVKCHIWFNLSSKLWNYYCVQRLYIVQPTSPPTTPTPRWWRSSLLRTSPCSLYFMSHDLHYCLQSDHPFEHTFTLKRFYNRSFCWNLLLEDKRQINRIEIGIFLVKSISSWLRNFENSSNCLCLQGEAGKYPYF